MGTGNSNCFQEPFVFEKYTNKHSIPSSFQVSTSNSHNDSNRSLEDKIIKLKQCIKPIDQNLNAKKTSHSSYNVSTKHNSNEPETVKKPSSRFNIDKLTSKFSSHSPDPISKLSNLLPVKVIQKNNSQKLFDKVKEKEKENPIPSQHKKKQEGGDILVLSAKPSQKKSKLDETHNEFVRGPQIGSGYYGKAYSGLSKLTGGICAIKVIKLNCEGEALAVLKQHMKKTVKRLSEIKQKNLILIKGFQEAKNTQGKILV